MAAQLQPQPRSRPETLRSALYELSDLLAAQHAAAETIRDAAQEAMALYQRERTEHALLSLLLRNLLSDLARHPSALDRPYYARQLSTAVDRL